MTKGEKHETSIDYSTLPDRLTRRFGVGSDPVRRNALYKRLQLACETRGEPAYIAIRTVAAECDGKRDPGRYFAKSVILRLRECGLMPLADL